MAPLPPNVIECIKGGHGYEDVKVRWPPRSRFQYSGGGYLMLQHLLELWAEIELKARATEDVSEEKNIPVDTLTG